MFSYDEQNKVLSMIFKPAVTFDAIMSAAVVSIESLDVQGIEAI